MKRKGLHSAILSAVLFGMSPVACKLVVGDMPSSLLAGLLYLGSGLGLSLVLLRQRIPARHLPGGRSARRRRRKSLAQLSSNWKIRRRLLPIFKTSTAITTPIKSASRSSHSAERAVVHIPCSTSTAIPSDMA